jgi:hypothetical protein
VQPRNAQAASVTAQQVAEIGSRMEGIGDELARGERERGVDSSVPLGDQVGAGGEALAVELGEALQRPKVVCGGEAQSGRQLPGCVPSLRVWISVSVAARHDQSMRAGSDLRKMLLSQDQS